MDRAILAVNELESVSNSSARADKISVNMVTRFSDLQLLLRDMFLELSGESALFSELKLLFLDIFLDTSGDTALFSEFELLFRDVFFDELVESVFFKVLIDFLDLSSLTVLAEVAGLS